MSTAGFDIPKDKGGRLAANVRNANIAEGMAMLLFRSFCAIAPVPREEDFGIDFIATLIRKNGRCLVAEESFVVQVKTSTSAVFSVSGDGIKWLTSLRLPYFPVVANLSTGSVSLYTLNEWHMPLHASAVKRFNFCVPNSDNECDGVDDFPLTTPLMTWSLSDIAHDDFPIWALSILKPVIEIESRNIRYAPMRRFETLSGGPYKFDPLNPTPVNFPKTISTMEVPLGDEAAILESLKNTLGPFCGWVTNQSYPDDRSNDLINLRDSLRRLGVDPDPTNKWDEEAKMMREYSKSPHGK